MKKATIYSYELIELNFVAEIPMDPYPKPRIPDNMYERLGVKLSPVSEILRGVAHMERYNENHAINRYADAFEGFHILVYNVINSGRDTVVFEMQGLKVLKITAAPLGDHWEMRHFDLPILERGTRDAGTGLILEWHVQAKAYQPVTQAEYQAFNEMLDSQGYMLNDTGIRQLGIHEDKVYLLDPLAVRRKRLYTPYTTPQS